MRRKTKTVAKLITAKSLNEAIGILEERKAPEIYKKHVSLAFNLKNDKDNEIRNRMLSETEEDLENEEKKKLDEMVHERVDDQGDARKTGESAQSDGEELDDVAPPGEGSHEGSEPAQSQTGTSQLEAALSEAINETHGIDPMNAAIIDYMSDGMSQVEAHNAATKDKKLSEAVWDYKWKQTELPILKSILGEIRSLKETIRSTDRKVEVARTSSSKQTGGFNEGIQMTGPVTTTAPTETGPKYDSSPEKINQAREDISAKYLDN